MKKIIKVLIFVVLLGITIITSVVGISKFEASELNVDEILINADFPQETIEKLSSYTKAELAKQILESDGFEYKIMTLNEVESMVTRGQIPDDDLTIIITTIINKVENGAVKEIKVKVYYEWTDLPVWRLEDPIVVQWDATKFSYQEGSFYSEDRYERDGDHLHISRTGYYDRNQDSFCWYADLKAGYFLGIGGTISKLYGFGELISVLKKNPKTIVFTEGTDPRILEASSRLLASNFLHPILIGNEDEIYKGQRKVDLISAEQRSLTLKNLTVWMRW